MLGITPEHHTLERTQFLQENQFNHRYDRPTMTWKLHTQSKLHLNHNTVREQKKPTVLPVKADRQFNAAMNSTSRYEQQHYNEQKRNQFLFHSNAHKHEVQRLHHKKMPDGRSNMAALLTHRYRGENSKQSQSILPPLIGAKKSVHRSANKSVRAVQQNQPMQFTTTNDIMYNRHNPQLLDFMRDKEVKQQRLLIRLEQRRQHLKRIEEYKQRYDMYRDVSAENRINTYRKVNQRYEQMRKDTEDFNYWRQFKSRKVGFGDLSPKKIQHRRISYITPELLYHHQN